MREKKYHLYLTADEQSKVIQSLRSIRIIGLSPTLNYDMNIKNKEVRQKWQIQNLMYRYGIKQT